MDIYSVLVRKMGCFRLTPLGLPKKGLAPFKNYQVWEDSALVPDTGRPPEGYPVFTVRTAAVNALGIPTVFFLGAILQCSLNLINKVI